MFPFHVCKITGNYNQPTKHMYTETNPKENSSYNVMTVASNVLSPIGDKHIEKLFGQQYSLIPYIVLLL